MIPDLRLQTLTRRPDSAVDGSQPLPYWCDLRIAVPHLVSVLSEKPGENCRTISGRRSRVQAHRFVPNRLLTV
jgi:hypothetical protein